MENAARTGYIGNINTISKPKCRAYQILLDSLSTVESVFISLFCCFPVREMAASNPGPGGTKDIYRNARAGMLLKKVGVKCGGEMRGFGECGPWLYWPPRKELVCNKPASRARVGL